MQKETRKAFDAYSSQVAKLNDIDDASKKFAVDPSVEQTMETVVQESSSFLQLVNSYGVDQQQGEKIGLSISTTIAGRTDTTVNERVPTDPSDMNGLQYNCKQTNFDTAIRYAKLDAWAKFPDFQTRMRDAVAQQIGRDRLMIGWNGTSAAVATDRVANPLLQDVNIGWLKKLQTNAAARYMTGGAVANQIRVGAGGDYANMDELIYDMRSNLLAPWFARDNGFIACLTADLLDEKYFPLVATHGGTPTEVNALDQMLSAKKLGGLRPAEIPFFPARTVFITALGAGGDSNLSIYWQKGSRRRQIIDNPKRDRVEDFQSVNEAYEIEDYSATCAAVNIKFPDGLGGWA